MDRQEPEVNEALHEELGLCGCGCPEEVVQYVGSMLIMLQRRDWQDYDNLPYMFFVYWANHNGYAEHGTTARCSWLTEKGERLLVKILAEKAKAIIDMENG